MCVYVCLVPVSPRVDVPPSAFNQSSFCFFVQEAACLQAREGVEKEDVGPESFTAKACRSSSRCARRASLSRLFGRGAIDVGVAESTIFVLLDCRARFFVRSFGLFGRSCYVLSAGAVSTLFRGGSTQGEADEGFVRCWAAMHVGRMPIGWVLLFCRYGTRLCARQCILTSVVEVGSTREKKAIGSNAKGIKSTTNKDELWQDGRV